MSLIWQIGAWLLAAATTFATLGPPRYRPVTALAHDFEHALAFVLIGAAFSLAYPRHRWQTMAVAVVLVGIVELLQLWMPGRHARLEDFIVNILTLWIGVVAIAIASRVFRPARL